MTLPRHLTRFLSGAAAAALLAALLTGCSAPALDQFSELLPGGDSSSPAPTAPVEPAEEAYASYPHFTDRVVTEEDHLLTLSNYKKNKFAFVYTLSGDGQELYRSEKLQPGESEAWDILQYCTTSCSLDITITAYTLPDDTEQNSVTQTIQLSLPEAAQTPAAPAASASDEGVVVEPGPGKKTTLPIPEDQSGKPEKPNKTGKTTQPVQKKAAKEKAAA